MSEKIVSFNVGGEVFETFRATIRSDQDSMLVTMMDSEIKTLDKRGNIFLDRDPELFKHILHLFLKQ